MSSCYDVIIVGGGVAGLYTGIELLKRYSVRCCILERNSYLGGRVYTFNDTIKGVGKVQWEAGAGRIATSHHYVRGLLTRYGLTFVPISSSSAWMDDSHSLTRNSFYQEQSLYMEPLRSLSKEILGTHTLAELLEAVHGKKKAETFYHKFPYHAEIHTMRADVALQSFDDEMGGRQAFGVCGEGLSELIRGMTEEYASLGGVYATQVEVQSVQYKPSSKWSLSAMDKCTKKPRFFQSSVCVLALPQSALPHIRGIRLPFLRHLRMEPLLRIYAIFPTTKEGSWFSNLPKVVCSGPVRYIIPIQPQKGIVMISYTDGDDTKAWSALSESQIRTKLMREIRSMFPEKSIPDPIYLKKHLWKNGCTYWLPGSYDPEEESQESLQPAKDQPLFLCNESFSTSQAWIESSLTQSIKMMELDSFQRCLRDCVTK